MNAKLREIVRSPRNRCFGCGPANPTGLRLDVEVTNGVARATFVPGEWHEGWEHVVHGGVLATALDEVMGYPLYYRGIVGVTARLELRFRRPARRQDRLLVEASVTRETKKLVDIAGAIRRDGDVLVEATGRFVKVGIFDQSVFD
jgi:acyl-coenzyme A thioesterase PaaI-like protein